MTEQQKHDPFEMSRFRQDICPAPTQPGTGDTKLSKDKGEDIPLSPPPCLHADESIWGDEEARNSAFYMV